MFGNLDKALESLYTEKKRLEIIFLATLKDGDVLKAKMDNSIHDHRAYSIYVDNTRHLKDAIEGIKTAIGHIELIRMDSIVEECVDTRYIGSIEQRRIEG